jgi:hypothetical protein
VVSNSPRSIRHAIAGAFDGGDLDSRQQGDVVELLRQRWQIVAPRVISEVCQDIQDPVVFHAETLPRIVKDASFATFAMQMIAGREADAYSPLLGKRRPEPGR